MTYPDTPGFQSHSDTSRAAAEQLVGQSQMQNKALAFVARSGSGGATIDEISVYLTQALMRFIPPGTASARVIELEKAGKITKTGMRRKTRSGRSAAVYVHAASVPLVHDYIILDEAGTIPDEAWKLVPITDSGRLTGYLDRMKHTGHGHVIARHDGKKHSCGGVAICRICKQEKEYLKHLEQKEQQ